MAEFGMFQFGNIVLPDTCAYEHGPMYISSCIYILPGMMLARIKYLDYLSDRRFRDSFSKDTRYCKRQNICSVCTLILITFFAIAGMLTCYTECGVEPVDMDDDGGRRLDIWRPVSMPSPWWEGEEAGSHHGEVAGERAGEQLDASAAFTHVRGNQARLRSRARRDQRHFVSFTAGCVRWHLARARCWRHGSPRLPTVPLTAASAAFDAASHDTTACRPAARGATELSTQHASERPDTCSSSGKCTYY